MPSVEKREFPPLAFGEIADETQGARPKHYISVGKVLVRWAKDRARWPNSIAEFEKQLHVTRTEGQGADDTWMYIPAVYTKISITQAGDGSGVTPNFLNGKPVDTGELESKPGSHTVTLQNSKPDGTEFLLRLPPASQVAESENHVAADLGYQLPPIYQDFSADMNMATSADDLARFYARVADYTMRGCR